MSETVDGRVMRITFDGARCIHARNCVLGLPKVFVANADGPWIHPDEASPEALVAAASRCPSGAIQVERIDGSPVEPPFGRNVVAVLENGPYAVRGDLQVAGEPGVRVTLCRCGASKRKPYCDGSHVAAGFASTGDFPAPAELPAWGPEEALVVTPIENGPLRVNGCHEVTSGGGRALRRGNIAFLCRCGASSNKPFCDGTHRKNGFTATGEPPRVKS